MKYGLADSEWNMHVKYGLADSEWKHACEVQTGRF